MSFQANDFNIIRIDKSTNARIIVPTLEIIQSNLFIVVVTTVTEGVNICNLAIRCIQRNGRNTPSVVRISCNSLSILVNDSNYVALQVLDEVVGNIVVENTAYRILIIVERNKRIVPPCFTENFRAVKGVGMLNFADCFARPDTVGVVGVNIVVKGFQLSVFFPGQSMTEVRGRKTFFATLP